MILEYRTMAWWYWLATVATLGAGIAAGWVPGVYTAMLLTVLHGHFFVVRGYGLTSFPLQVRIAYLLLLVAGLWPPLAFIHWLQLAGTTARVLFAYCLLARTLSLMPWNRQGPLDWQRVWRTYTTPPTRGSFLQAFDTSRAV
jgi:hypothetical protein